MSTSLDSCPDAEQLVEFVEGTLPAQARRIVERHLDGCRFCVGALGLVARDGGPDEASSIVETAPVHAPGAWVGRYEIVEELGRGAMGIVYAARDPELDRRVALKVLHVTDDDQRRRMLAEARMLASVEHPNVVEIFDVLDDCALAMELVEGDTLRDRIDTKAPPPWREVVTLMIGVGQGLAATHTRGVVHRDIKPENVLIDEQGRGRLTDFGLATADAGPQHSKARRGAGTPAYMAPEVLQGAPGNAQSDQFGFCVTMFEALYGVRPFEGTSRSTPIDFGNRNLPKRVQSVLARGLQARPENRYPSMQALVDDLAEGAAPPQRWIAAGLAVCVAASAGWALIRAPTDPCTDFQARLEQRWEAIPIESTLSTLRSHAIPYAAETAQRVAAELHRKRNVWIDGGIEVCSSGARGLDEAWRCLEHDARTVEATVELLAEPDPVLLDHAVSAVESLPSGSACVAGPFEVPTGDSIGLLIRAQILLDVGDLDGVEVLLTEHPETSEIGSRARGSFLRGSLAHARSEHEDAARWLQEAYALAGQSGQSDLAARAAIHLVRVMGIGQERPADAEHWSGVAEHASRATGSPTLHAQQLQALADLRRQQGNKSEALSNMRAALALVEQQTGPGSVRTLDATSGLAATLLHYDEFVEAEQLFTRARDGYAEVLGQAHPSTTRATKGLSTCARMLGDLERARTLLEAAVHSGRARGGNVEELANDLQQQGQLAYAAGNPDDALNAMTEGLALLRSVLPDDHLSIARAQSNRAVVLASVERHEEARVALLGAIEIYETHDDVDAFTLAVLHTNLALSEKWLGRFDEAQSHYEQSLRTVERVRGREDLALVHPLSGLGDLLVLRGEIEAGVAHLERALQIANGQQGRPLQRANASFALAKALAVATPAQLARAQSLATAAREQCLAFGAGADSLRRDIEAWQEARGGSP